METMNNITLTSETSFDAVQMMRDIRNRISLKTANMTFLQLKEYMQQKRNEADKGEDVRGTLFSSMAARK